MDSVKYYVWLCLLLQTKWQVLHALADHTKPSSTASPSVPHELICCVIKSSTHRD